MGYMALYRKWRPSDFDEVGTIKDVLETGANEVYVVALPNGKELLDRKSTRLNSSH